MSIYDTLNPEQKDAVFFKDGPMLILAGAGSGKTRVLTHRMAYFIEEERVSPWNILAITFTNKAAREMRERVNQIVGYGADDIWVSTFHSTCVRILRRECEAIGYDRSFTIYDSDDQKRLIKEIMKTMQIDSKLFPERSIMSEISKSKDELITANDYAMSAENEGDFRKKRIGQVYLEYQRRLVAANAFDFDDLIVKTVQLLQSNPDILERYQDRFHYIMIDEYQDTNTAQFVLIKLLADKYKNICVVGDDDQSIYKFRGANIYNILNFEKVYPNAKVVKLEQNYRSTGNILEAANSVIARNRGRKPKRLWTSSQVGDLVVMQSYRTEHDESHGVVSEIKALTAAGVSFHEIAILYRTNAQSRVFEEKLIIGNIPYRIFGGQNFYQRKEIKDIISYLKTIGNSVDDLAVKRIINVPKRGIGNTTLDKIQMYADDMELSFYEAMRQVEQITSIAKSTASKIERFVILIEGYKHKANSGGVSALMKEILQDTGYLSELEAEHTEESQSRIENIEELLNKAVSFDNEATETGDSSLAAFLEEIALIADIDNLEEESSQVALMTLHSAKGLEFPYVFLVGMEDNLFPSYMSLHSDDKDDIEEERRLCYVGITRAMRKLYLCHAKQRMMHGQTQYNQISRFVSEIADHLLDIPEQEKIVPHKQQAKKTTFEASKKTMSTKPFGVSLDNIPKGKMDLDYGVGSTVKHIKFGEGTVIKIEEDGDNTFVTVNFNRVGIKRMSAAFARLQKI